MMMCQYCRIIKLFNRGKPLRAAQHEGFKRNRLRPFTSRDSLSGLSTAQYG